MQARAKIRKRLKEAFAANGEMYELFKSYLVRALFKLIYDSYNDRSKGRPDKYGFVWDPLSPVTVKRKKGKGRSDRQSKLIMIDTRKLLRSFKPGTVTLSGYNRANNDQMFVINKMSVRIGTKVSYAVFAKRPVLPSRLLELIVPAAVKSAVRSIKPHLERKLKND